MPSLCRFSRGTFIAMVALLASTPVMAQDWPAKPITLVVPFPPGGGTDLVVRAVQGRLAALLGQPVVIDNRAGAGGTVGSAFAARARPDGYTALAVTTSTHAVSASVYKHLPYDPIMDFSYVGLIGASPYVLAVNPAVAASDVRSLVSTLSRRSPNGTFGSVGVGTVSHLLGEKFQKLAGLTLVHVPYRGAAPAYTDLIGGQIDMVFDNPVGLTAYVQAGKLTAVATTAPTPLLPQVRTFAHQGMEGLDQSLWYGIALPKGTPKAIVEKFSVALRRALEDPAVSADLAAKGVTVQPGSAQALADRVAHDVPFWGEIAQSVGAVVD
jgi:tripartite-type tricarboxylate transporter receptor subunit TctC